MVSYDFPSRQSYTHPYASKTGSRRAGPFLDVSFPPPPPSPPFPVSSSVTAPPVSSFPNFPHSPPIFPIFLIWGLVS